MERQTIAVNLHEEIDEEESTAVIAVCSSLLSLPAIYAAARTVIWMHHPSWTPWLLTSMFIVIPAAVAFIILYFGCWHLEWQRPKRILWAILSSCLIYVADIFLTAWIAVIGICVLQFFTGF
jgi:ABC-type arginine/histidine transport system permease subunit